jgi:hypothetical protein
LSLRRLSNLVQSDVMADGRVSEQFKIPTHRPASLGPHITLNQKQLLAQFRDVLAGKRPRALANDNGAKIDATIDIQENGTANVRIDGTVFGFAFAGLLSPTAAERLKYLDSYLNSYTLAVEIAGALREKVSLEPFSDEDFLSTVETLHTAQESFVQNTRATVAVRELTTADLFPANIRYWDNLVAPWQTSGSLVEFIGDERLKELPILLSGNVKRALQAISLSFCAPALVPIEEVKSIPKEELLQALDRLASLPDHFGLTGAFEICASLDLDKAVEVVGIKLLDALLDMDRLEGRCTFYGAIFSMAAAHLAEHSALSKKPAFWRRITAAAHASLVLRACGSEDAESVFRWAMQNFGKTFLLSVLLEMNEEPRWKPDWLTAKHLVADAAGRVEHAVNKIPEAQRPKAWSDRVATAREWVSTRQLGLFSTLPAIGESARKSMISTDQTLLFEAKYREFADNPSVDSLLACGSGLFTVGVTDDIVRACHGLIERLQKDGARWTDENVQFAVQVLAFVAVQSRDTKLADLVADFCVGKIRDLPDDGSTLEIVCRLVECASADTTREQAINALARRLEAVAFLAPIQSLIDLSDTILRLQALDPRLAPELGKAMAATRLGQSAI